MRDDRAERPWPRSFQLGRALMAAGFIGLGIVGLVFGDFVQKWQPVPVDMPWRLTIAGVSNVALLVGGSCLLLARGVRIAAGSLALFLSSWIVLLQLPSAAADPGSLGAWGYLCGDLAVVCGLLVLQTLSKRSIDEARRQSTLRTLGAARAVFALTIIFFGTTHLVYAEYMLRAVPALLPFPLEIIYVTGCAHIAAGLALLLGVVPRLAATLEAAMMTSFVLLVDVRHVFADVASQRYWNSLCFELALIGAAWLVAASCATYPPKRRL